MKTVINPSNPVVEIIVQGLNNRVLAFYNDVPKHLEHMIKNDMEAGGPETRLPGDSLMIDLVIASAERIEHYEETMGIAVMTFDESVEYVKQHGNTTRPIKK